MATEAVVVVVVVVLLLYCCCVVVVVVSTSGWTEAENVCISAEKKPSPDRHELGDELMQDPRSTGTKKDM